MRLPVSIHTYYIVYRGYTKWLYGSYGSIHETKQLAIVDNEADARVICGNSSLPYVSDRSIRKMRKERAESKERVVSYYSVVVAIWDNHKYKGAFPIPHIPIKRGLCATGLFLMRRNKAGKVVRTEASKYGQRHQNVPKKRAKPKMIRASRVKRTGKTIRVMSVDELRDELRKHEKQNRGILE